jgi:hypothetical protein
LFASVPPEVNTTSSSSHWSSAATCPRAFSTASRAERPNAWALEGLPKWSRRNGIIASTTSGRTGVVAL